MRPGTWVSPAANSSRISAVASAGPVAAENSDDGLVALTRTEDASVGECVHLAHELLTEVGHLIAQGWQHLEVKCQCGRRVHIVIDVPEIRLVRVLRSPFTKVSAPDAFGIFAPSNSLKTTARITMKPFGAWFSRGGSTYSRFSG